MFDLCHDIPLDRCHEKTLRKDSVIRSGLDTFVEWRERVSALVFFVLGLYVTENRNLVKSNAHLACLGFRRLAECRYSRFL